jgi:cytochrome c
MRTLATLLAFALLASFGGAAQAQAQAQERATTKDAEKLVHSAADYLKKVGKEKAFAEFSDPKGKFTYRDLYIVVLDFHNVVLAHPRHELIGKDHTKVLDPDGKPYAKMLVDVARANGSGWTEYKYVNPATQKMETKVAYSEMAGDVVLLCGAFRESK